jgi:signal peptidase II
LNSRFLFWIVFLFTLGFDQASKVWVRTAIGRTHGDWNNGWPWPGVFELTYTTNKGIAFGMLQGAGVYLAPIAVGIAVAAWMYSHRNNGDGKLSHVAMALLASGALGNLYDRVAHGQVTDLFWFRLINFPVFNVADSCITIAAGLLVIKWTREFFQEKEKARADAMGPGAQGEPIAEAPTETVSSSAQ